MRAAASRILGVPAAVTVLLCALAILGGSAVERPRPDLRLTGATGAMAIGNDRENEAVLSAAGLIPGGAVRGRVTVAAGSAILTLSATPPVDTPGPGGGLLSGRLRLSIDDVTDSSSPHPVFSGALGDLPAIDLGTAPGGASRVYEFRVAFPDARSADLNAYMASSMSVDFSWDATAPDAPQPEPSGGGTTASQGILHSASSSDPPDEALGAEHGAHTDVPITSVAPSAVRRPAAGAPVLADPAAGHRVSAKLTSAAGKGWFTGRYTIDKNGGVLTWKVTYAAARGSTVTAHIHPRGKGGRVLVSLCTRCAGRTTGTVRISKAVRRALASGKVYVNVHTNRNPTKGPRGRGRATRRTP